MTNPEIIVERKKYGSSAMDYTMRVYQKLDEETIMIDGVKYQKVEEPKPQTLYEMFCKEHGQFITEMLFVRLLKDGCLMKMMVMIDMLVVGMIVLKS